MLNYDIDVSNIDFHKKNLPQDLENSVLIFKKNLVGRESIAWEIARNIMHFQTPKEKFIFDKVREYALATYNYGDLKSIIKENNLESFFKYKKYFA